MNRRTLLAAAGVGIGSLAGCLGVISSDDDGNESSSEETDGFSVGDEEADSSNGDAANAPVYGDEPDDPDQQLRLQVTVFEDGAPLESEPVIYHDYGGSYDNLEGETGEDGTAVFVDSVGPPPCNSIEIELPDRGETVDVGCHNGGKEISETIDVGNDA